ncbi:GNAT family N-acetyltransferase [Lacticaseibacillus saniviri]|uniref:Acetyltransferase n=1 Tax=Lacticaseibacillus saniviri JCM 17471 = DSM 24301 TaxID=1293598 RepID=A0A0R2MY44_9LACO|nr:GNAT family N-acetyltransferase [Lacticaseibacillus saniviri]KRO18356.1 acetyltransferase [Lacticaseibacillus saniviri JCM 17471 = DSM 24301]MCG4282192.1 GNAT family N-acetyltransferase [Lacticaseibacillus saniviri]
MADIRDELELRQVTLAYLDQFNDLLSYVFQVTAKEVEESGYEEGELERAKRPVLEKSDVIGWFHNDELISQLAIYPCVVNIHGKAYQMAGLTGVGTYPEYAGHGLMHDLIRVGLDHMRARHQSISYLYPYSIPFYRKKGWEIMSDHLTFEVKDSQLPKPVVTPGHVERLEIDDPDVIETYQRFAKTNHGAMIRNQLNWDEYWRWENEEERIAAVYYDEQDVPQGFILYWIADEIFHIKEMVYTNQEARIGLWNFISAHFSMVNYVRGNIYKNEPLHFLLDDGDIKQTIKPYFMARIVDVRQFLIDYPFEASGKPFHFVVSDPLAEWNNGVVGLTWVDGQLHLTDEPVGEAVELDIQTLTTMMMSYRRPSYLAKIERIQASKPMLKELEAIIPVDEPYFSDYF